MYKEFFAMIKRNRQNNTIIIDGVVGVGKSALLEIVAEEFGLDRFLEPVEDNPILDKFYHNRPRYAFPLQIFFLNRRFKMLKAAASHTEPTVMDRSIYGDIIFAKLLNQGGDMENDEFELYMDLLVNMLDHIEPPKLMIYLKADTDTAIERIKKRGRDYEQIVEREYWEALNREYSEYFSEYNLSPLLTIETKGLDFIGNPEDRDYVVGLIRAKLQEIDSNTKDQGIWTEK